MNKELLDKVLAVLSKHGIEKEVLDEVESELSEEAPVAPEDAPVEEEAEPTPEDAPVEGEGDAAPVEEPEPVEDVVPEGEQAPVEDAPVPETPAEEAPVADQGLPEGVEEVQLGQEVPPVQEPEPVAPDTPAIDYEAKFAEYEKVIEAQDARINALEEALRKGGILEDEKPSVEPVGVDDPTNISDYHDDEETFDNLLERLNRKH